MREVRQKSVPIVSFLPSVIALKISEEQWPEWGQHHDHDQRQVRRGQPQRAHAALRLHCRGQAQGIKCGQWDIMCVAGWATQGIQPHSSQEDWCVLQEDLPHSLFHFRILFLYQVSGCIERVYWSHIFVPGTMQLRELSPTPRYSSTNDNIPE